MLCEMVEQAEYRVVDINPYGPNFIEAFLVDTQGNPLQGTEYVVILPDGTQRRGSTDFEGRVRMVNLPEGEVKLELVEEKLLYIAPEEDEESVIEEQEEDQEGEEIA